MLSRESSVSFNSNSLSPVDIRQAYYLLQIQAVRQRIESERDRLLLEEELRVLQQQVSSGAKSPARVISFYWRTYTEHTEIFYREPWIFVDISSAVNSCREEKKR